MTTEHPSQSGPEQGQQRTITMPPFEQMVTRLEERQIGGASVLAIRVAKAFAAAMDREREVSGMALASTWRIIEQSMLRYVPRKDKKGVSGHFFRAVDAIVPDSDVARDAKKSMQKLYNENTTPPKST